MKEIAEKYIERSGIPGIRLNEIEETADYYCFNCYHPTKNYVGQGLVFINKSDNRFFEYGSGNLNPKKDFLKEIMVEKEVRKNFSGFDIQKYYDLKINRIFRRSHLIDKLLDLSLEYTIPEVVGNDIFRIPKSYNRKILEKRLKVLPAEFTNISAIKISEVFFLNNKYKTLEFGIVEHIDSVKVNRLERASDSDFKTIW